MKHMKIIPLALIALSAMLVSTGCAQKPRKTAKFTLGTVSQLEKALFQGDSIKKALYNEEGKFAHVLNNEGALFHVKLENGLQDIHDKKNWKKHSLKNEANDDTAGKAKLEEQEHDPKLRQIFPTKNGILLLTTVKDSTNFYSALAYFEAGEDKPKLAWKSDSTHADGALAVVTRGPGGGTATAPAIPDYIYSQWASAAAVTSGDSERIIIINKHGQASSVPLEAKQIKGDITYAGGAFGMFLTSSNSTNADTTNDTINFSSTHIVEDDDTVFFVNNKGVSFIKKSDLGDTDKDIDAVATEASSDKWQFPPATGATAKLNDKVSQVVLHKGKIYIALKVAGNSSGGVAIYDIAAKTTLAPDLTTWNRVAATNLLVAGDKIKALVRGAITDIDDKGEILDTFGPANIRNSKFKSDAITLNKDLDGKTFYDGQVNSIEEFNTFFYIGKDMLVETYRRYFTIIFEDKVLDLGEADEDEDKKDEE